ncbi:MAG: hypothetical protein ACI8WB_004476, partial [Phenylobacterium sp.]
MSFDIIIVVVVVSVFAIIIWRLNRKNSTPSYSEKSTSRNTSQKKAASATSQFHADNTMLDLPLEPAPEQTVEPAEPASQENEPEMPRDFLNFALLEFDDLDEQQQHEIELMTKSFQKPHPLLLPLTRGVFEPNELFDLIKTDPEMTAKILKAVNSPMFGLKQPITSIHHAIIFMGVGQVKNIAMQFLLQNSTVAKKQSKEQAQADEKLWTASHMASTLCLLLAKELGSKNAAELSTQCLLCYLGDMAMLSYKPSIASNYLNHLSLHERVKSVQSALSTNTAVIGKILAEQWQLPASIINGIENSLLPLVDNNTDKELSTDELQNTLLCYLSCRIGDLVAFEGVTDIAQVGKLDTKSMAGFDFFYIQ